MYSGVHFLINSILVWRGPDWHSNRCTHFSQFDIIKAASLFLSSGSPWMSRAIVTKPSSSCLNSSAQLSVMSNSDSSSRENEASNKASSCLSCFPSISCSTGCWITWATLPRRPACRTSSRRAKPKSASSLTTGAPTAPTEPVHSRCLSAWGARGWLAVKHSKEASFQRRGPTDQQVMVLVISSSYRLRD